MSTRRDFIKQAALLTGLAGGSGIVPASIQRAFAITPAPGSTFLDAEHIVILMQENRSFDHAMGSLQGVRGFNDPRAIRQANGNNIWIQSGASGETYAPWRLDIKDTRATWMGSVPHTRHSQVDAWNHGHHNNWIDAKRPHSAKYAHVPFTMGHYTRQDIPFYYALADAFTICDQHYAACMTSTTPNRSVFWTGTVRDKQSTDSMVYMRNEELERGNLKWTTYPERLTKAGVSWKFYQNEITENDKVVGDEESKWLGNYGCNPLEDFAAYNVKADPATLDEHSASLHNAAFTRNIGDPHYRSLETITFEETGKPTTMQVPKGDVLHQFREDVNTGKLPTVSWLASPEKFSDHPSSPWYGAWYVSEVVDILTKNPEVWKKTIFILTYDENDGYFDHAPTYAAPDPKRRETGRASAGIDTGLEYTSIADEAAQGVKPAEQRGGPIGLGFRVPMIVASPWTRGGWVNSQLFDHTSTLQFLETYLAAKQNKQVKEVQISDFRRAICGDLTSLFRTHDDDTAKLSFLQRDPFVESIQLARHKEIPSNYIRLSDEQIAEINRDPLNTRLKSQQEEGIRPSNAIPYELYADGTREGDHFVLTLTAATTVHGAKSAGAPFNVYLRNTKQSSAAAGLGPHATNENNLLVATYIVKAGDTLQQSFPLALFKDEAYQIEVVAPNGFYRQYTGATTSGGLRIRSIYEGGQHPTGNLTFALANTAAEPVTLSVTDNAYKSAGKKITLAAGATRSITLQLKRNHHWYDVSLHTANTHARYAGRVETGNSSYSDPFMGRVV